MDSQGIVGGSRTWNGTTGRCPGSHPSGAIRSARGWQRSDAATSTVRCLNAAVGPQPRIAALAPTTSIAELQLCPALVAKSGSIAESVDSVVATGQLARAGSAREGQLSPVARSRHSGWRTLHRVAVTCGRTPDGHHSAWNGPTATTASIQRNRGFTSVFTETND